MELVIQSETKEQQCPDMSPTMIASRAAEQAPTCGYAWSAVPVFMFVPAVVPHHFSAAQQQDSINLSPADVEFDGSSEQEDIASTPAVSRRHRKRQKARASKKQNAFGSSDESTSHEILDVSPPVHTSAAVSDPADE